MTWTSPTSSSEASGLFLHRDRVTGPVQVEVAFTGNQLDLAERPSELGAIEAAVTRLAEVISVPVARMHQVHGIAVHEVVRDENGAWGPVPEADALVTREPGIALMARSADCVPVLLADAEQGVIGAVHAGRVGFDDGIVPAAVKAMNDLGARELQAWIGPAACGSCYEVPEQMRDEVASRHPAVRSETSWGTTALDVPGGVRAQLEDLGVRVEMLGPCTIEAEETFSHRRQAGAAGRSGALIWRVA